MARRGNARSIDHDDVGDGWSRPRRERIPDRILVIERFFHGRHLSQYWIQSREVVHESTDIRATIVALGFIFKGNREHGLLFVVLFFTTRVTGQRRGKGQHPDRGSYGNNNVHILSIVVEALVCTSVYMNSPKDV